MLSRTTRILLLVAVLAGGLYWLLGRTKNDNADNGVVASFDRTRVDHLELKRTDNTLRFVLEDSVWKMSSPVSDVAEPSTIIALLNALDHAEIARDLGAMDDLSQFGLAPPELEIVAVAQGDTVLDVDVGKRTVDDAWCYASTRDRNLLLIPTSIARAASLPLDAYRNQRVVDFQLSDIDTYELRTAGSMMRWSHTPSGWYANHEGARVRGDSVAVESILRRLRGMRISAFPSPSDPAEALPTPIGEISLLRADQRVEQLSFHRTAGERQVAIRQSEMPRVVFINDDISDVFAHTLTELRDRRLVQFSPPDAQRIDVNLPGASGSITRSGGAWSFPNPAMGRVDAERAADFVRGLRSLKWTDVSDVKTALQRASGFSVTVSGPGDTIIDEMKIEPRDKLWLVTSRSSRGVWLIDKENIDALAKLFAQVKTQ